ncbi:MAG: glycosyltransferase family 4 protein [Planctomycetes bacterium]|nr:glycosyltransferase family 4 protein [Planctomycetota bacterium]
MRVAIEATTLCEERPSGIGRYARRLLHALAALPASERPDLSAWCRRSYRRKSSFVQPPAGVPVRIYQEPVWPLWAPCDILHGVAVRTPRWRGCRRLSSIMDLTPFLNPGGLDAGHLERDQRALREAAAHCHGFIAISQATKDDAVRILGIPAARVWVTHLGVAGGFRPHSEAEISPVLARLDLPRRFLLAVGDLHPRKNLPRLIEALAASRAWADAPLVLVGKPSMGGAEQVEAAAARCALPADRVRRLSYVEDGDLPVLYAAAAALCYPSLYEGFGFPIIEAMRSGTPVLTSAVSSCPEVAGGHAVLVDPADTGAIAAGLERLPAIGAAQREAARAHADGFTWERCARQTVQVYRELMA